MSKINQTLDDFKHSLIDIGTAHQQILALILSREEILELIEDNLECKDDDIIGCHINGKNLLAHQLYEAQRGKLNKEE